jgi:hypothetical protein
MGREARGIVEDCRTENLQLVTCNPNSHSAFASGPDVRGQLQIEVAEMKFSHSAVGKFQREQLAVVSENFANLTGPDEASLFGEERQPTVGPSGCFTHAHRHSSRNARLGPSPGNRVSFCGKSPLARESLKNFREDFLNVPDRFAPDTGLFSGKMPRWI